MAAEYNLDDLNKHYLYLERLASGGINSVVLPSLSATYDAVAAILNGYDGITSRAELNAITKAIDEAINSNAGWATLTAEGLAPLALYEAEWQANYAAAATGLSASVLAERTILNFINRALMSLESGPRVDVGVWGDFVESNIESRSKQINGIVQRGFMRGETIQQMRRQIKQVTEGLLTREAEALARTGYVHYAAQATEAMVQANKDILEEYYYIITFDNRLSSICRQIGVKFNDPKSRFKVGDPKAPTPPHHFNAVAGGELINTESGYKPIENVAVGEKVWTHKGRLKPVTAVMKKANDTSFVRVIRCDSGKVIRVTDEHPVLVSGRGWVRADEVKVGDRVFQKYSDKRPVVNGSPIIKGNPNNYPSIFDGEEVFFKVGLESGCMASTINFNDNLMLGNCKISDGAAKDKLPFKRDWLGREEVGKGLFTFNFNSIKGVFERFNPFVVELVNINRVGVFHSNRVSHVNSASFFGFTKSPMIFANAKPFFNFLSGGNLGSIRATDGLNSVNSAPSAHSAISKVVFPFNLSKRFASRVVMRVKELLKSFLVSKVKDGCHFCSPIVTDISIVEYNDEVYNLEVMEDHTYMVGDIIVHNCRTRRLAVPEGFELTGTRAAVGGNKGEEAAKAFADKERRLRTKSKVTYKGKKDTNIFNPGQVDASEGYEAWLRRQPRWFVEDSLGVGKAKLFLDDKLSLTKFSDLTAQPLTLAEIKRREGKS